MDDIKLPGNFITDQNDEGSDEFILDELKLAPVKMTRELLRRQDEEALRKKYLIEKEKTAELL